MIAAKVMMLGDIGVGKSSVARRMVFGRFEADYKTTIGVDIMTCTVALPHEADGAGAKLMIWDTDGDFGQRIFETAYVAGASGAVIVSDATRPQTLERMCALAARFAERFPGRPIRTIVNKIDLVAAPPAVESEACAGFTPLYTSAMTGAGVQSLFEGLAAELWRRGSGSR